MRLPNGFGSVVKLSGKRRRPYMARKTTGWDDNAYPIYEVIGYYETRQAALTALVKYNENPYDLKDSGITMKALYDKYLDERGDKLGVWLKSALKTAIRNCSQLHDIPYKNIRAYQMQNMINAAGGYASQKQIKTLFYHLDRFAFSMDLINKQYSEVITIDQAPDESSRTPFTKAEVADIWRHESEPWVDSVLFFIYTGFRISEGLSIKKSDVDLEQLTIKGGVKTASGKNRIVPIHPKIEAIVRKRYAASNIYLFEYNDHKVHAPKYYEFWSTIMISLGMDHVVHECRHTLRSEMDSAGANKVCIDMIMGHKSKGIGERVYTHKTLQELREALAVVTL